ncbi:HCL644Cp [Eremothecium sinecaudum]|uniref:HCL644Cp n=1 Tax=Eremothecium sinecaudum TaxID=45286 RepID=A0A109UYI9_9SACH|nr:HCL644Cp [Eremothecium sinecaudum]AMD19507.1 HCL644Cp [Eremothecium sinecaudum]
MVAVDVMKNGFLVIPFALPSCEKLFESSGAMHYMFVKKHQTKNASESNCLFLVNLPLLASLDSIKSSFGSICSQYDTVAHILQLLYHDEFGLNEIQLSELTSDLVSLDNAEEKRYTPRNTALLQFVDESSLNNCWDALRRYSHKAKSLIQWEFPHPSVSTFTNFYKPLDIEYLKNDIHEHMQLFEQREALAQDEVQSTIVDEDGFTLVVGKNTKSLNSIRRKLLHGNPLFKHVAKAKPPNMITKNAKQDFYRFQMREKKKQEVNELLKKFKEDQERIKVMKAKKKFNPYT